MTGAFHLDDRQLDVLQTKLVKFSRYSVPTAARFYLNRMATQCQEYGRQEIRNNMIVRNAWTERSVQVQYARGSHMRSMHSVTGSVQPYMAVQEFGGTKTASGKHGVPLATGEASGEGRISSPRKRLPKRVMKMQNIKLSNKASPKDNKKLGIILAIRQAQASGKGFVFLNLPRGPAIYRVTGQGSGGKLSMIHDLSKKSVSIPKTPWLGRAVERTQRDGTTFAREALYYQAKRAGFR